LNSSFPTHISIAKDKKISDETLNQPIKFIITIIQNNKAYSGCFFVHIIAEAIKTDENAIRPNIPK
jgi:hypothetical protein